MVSEDARTNSHAHNHQSQHHVDGPGLSYTTTGNNIKINTLPPGGMVLVLVRQEHINNAII